MRKANSGRIMVVVNDLERYGSQRVVLSLAGSFSELGRSVLLVCIERPTASWLPAPEGVELVSLQRPATPAPLTLLILAIRLRRLVRQEQSVSVLSNMTFSNIIAATSTILQRRRPPLVLVEHNRLSATLKVERSARWIARVVPPLYSRANLVVGVSQGVVDDFERNFRVPITRLRRIYNPVPLREAHRQPSHRWLTEERDFHLLVCVGALRAAKGHEVLLRAIARLSHSEHKMVRLVCVGDGSLSNELISLAQRLDLSDTVDFVGYDDNVGGWLDAADIFVMPSLWEGFGLVAVEAAQHGLPVIASDIEGLRELVPSFVPGTLVPPGDDAALAVAIVDAITQRPAAPAQKSARHLSEFRPDSVGKKYLELLDSEASSQRSLSRRRWARTVSQRAAVDGIHDTSEDASDSVELDHVVLTRFNIPLGHSGASDQFADIEWLRRRCELFERFCLPSMAHQRDSDVRWVVLVWSGTPEEILVRLAEGVSGVSGACILKFESVPAWEGFGSEIADRLQLKAGWLLTTRLDSDDTLSDDAVKSARAAAVKSLRRGNTTQQAFNFPYGFTAVDGRLFHVLDLHNPFFSLLEQRNGATRTALGYAHHNVRRYVPVKQVIAAPSWIQQVHGSNLVNSSRGVSRVAPTPPSRFAFLLELQQSSPDVLVRRIALSTRTLVNETRRLTRRGSRRSLRAIASRTRSRQT